MGSRSPARCDSTPQSLLLREEAHVSGRRLHGAGKGERTHLGIWASRLASRRFAINMRTVVPPGCWARGTAVRRDEGSPRHDAMNVLANSPAGSAAASPRFEVRSSNCRTGPCQPHTICACQTVKPGSHDPPFRSLDSLWILSGFSVEPVINFGEISLILLVERA